MSLPTLQKLRQQLNVLSVNTGRRIEFFGPQGIIGSDMEGLHAQIDSYGRTVLCSGVEFPPYMYRGQTQDFGQCVPALARVSDVHKQFLALCRSIAFEDAIGCHPLVQLVEQTSFMDSPFFVDREGLAQHYGHPTSMLDITCNFDVASFFATCRWDSEKKTYFPYWNETIPGVIYRIHSVFFDHHPDAPELSIVGWQPLPRPAQQRAQALQLKQGQDFQHFPCVEKFEFSHNVETSSRIYEAFDQGRALFPPDAAAELSALAENLFAFTGEQIERAWGRFNAWADRDIPMNEQILVIDRCAIEVVDAPVLNWEGLLPDLSPDQWRQQWEEVLCRIKYRRVFFPT